MRRKEVPIWSQSIYLTGQQYNRVGRWFSPSIHDLTVTFFYKYRCLSSSGCIISLKLTKLPITLIWFWAPDHPYSKKGISQVASTGQVLIQPLSLLSIRNWNVTLFPRIKDTGRERLIRSHSSARFCFELSDWHQVCNSSSR